MQVRRDLIQSRQMKTIYTDRYGIYHWGLLVLSISLLWSAYDTYFGGGSAPFGLSKFWGSLLFVGSAGIWLWLAVKRLREIKKAKREGRDPTIMSVEESEH